MEHSICAITLFLLASLSWPSATAEAIDLPNTAVHSSRVGRGGGFYDLTPLINIITCGMIRCDMEKSRLPAKEQRDEQPPGHDAMQLLADMLASTDGYKRSKALPAKPERISTSKSLANRHRFPQAQHFKSTNTVPKKLGAARTQSRGTEVVKLLTDLTTAILGAQSQAEDSIPGTLPDLLSWQYLLDEILKSAEEVIIDVSSLSILLDEMFESQAKNNDFIPGTLSDSSNLKILLDEIFKPQAKAEGRVSERLLEFSPHSSGPVAYDNNALKEDKTNVDTSSPITAGRLLKAGGLRNGEAPLSLLGLLLNGALNPETAMKEDNNWVMERVGLLLYWIFGQGNDSSQIQTFDGLSTPTSNSQRTPRIGTLLDWIFGKPNSPKPPRG